MIHGGKSFRRGKIGIIAGSGPEAGIDLWRKILEENRAAFGADFRGDLDAPHVVVHSIPELGLSMEMERFEKEVWTTLERGLRDISGHVDFICIACNTLNYFQDEIDRLPFGAKFVSFYEVVRDYLLRRPGGGGVALLGARQVAGLGGWSPYRRLAGRMEIETFKDPDRVHRLIEDIKKYGPEHPPLAVEFRAILDSLNSGVVLLACTELPLVSVEAPGKELVDVTRLVAREMVARSLSVPVVPDLPEA